MRDEKILKSFLMCECKGTSTSSNSSEALFKQKPEERKAKRESKIGNKTNGRVERESKRIRRTTQRGKLVS
jgi:hypothetical protein